MRKEDLQDSIARGGRACVAGTPTPRQEEITQRRCRNAAFEPGAAGRRRPVSENGDVITVFRSTSGELPRHEGLHGGQCRGRVPTSLQAFTPSSPSSLPTCSFLETWVRVPRVSAISRVTLRQLI